MKVIYAVVYMVACLSELFASWAKEWAALKLKHPAPTPSSDPLSFTEEEIRFYKTRGFARVLVWALIRSFTSVVSATKHAFRKIWIVKFFV